MTRKPEFGIVCNGEHLERGFESREAAAGREPGRGRGDKRREKENVIHFRWL